LNILDRTLDIYKKEARTNERMGRVIDRIGFDRFRDKVLEEPLVH